MKKDFAKLSLLGLLMMVQTAYAQKRVGINVENATNTLHIKPVSPDTKDPLRLEGLEEMTGLKHFLMVNDEGVVKKAVTQREAVARIVGPNNGGDVSGAHIVNTNNSPQVFKINATAKNYDAATGEYTIQEDGLYEVSGVIRMQITTENRAFDGTAGQFTIMLIKNNDFSNRLSGHSALVYRGLKTQGTSVPIMDFRTNTTTWLNKGDKITLQYVTYGANGMVYNTSNMKLLSQNSSLSVVRIL